MKPAHAGNPETVDCQAQTLRDAPSIVARIGAVMLCVQPLYIVAELVTASTVAVPYNLAHNLISGLGATVCTTIAYGFGHVPVCSPWHAVINIAFVTSGLLLSTGAVLVLSRLRSKRGVAGVTLLWVLAGLGVVSIGLVPINENFRLHSLMAVVVFLAVPAAVFCTARALREQHVLLARSGYGPGLPKLRPGAK